MARLFEIVTDTGSDLPAWYYETHNVHRILLGFTIDGVTYGEGEDAELDVKEFYERMRAGAMPKTFQITPDQALNRLRPLAEAGKDVLVVSFSSGLSGTYQSYCLAATQVKQEFPNAKVEVVDSLCASLGQGLFVDYIVKKADAGATLEETVTFAEELKPHLCHYFTVDNLFHLKRGGRVSGATALLGTMLKIKPVLHVDDEGHLIAVSKVMGRKKSISALVEKMEELQTLEKDDPVFISHGDCREDVEYLLTLLKQKFGEREYFVEYLGNVIGTHTGAGVIALFFKGKKR